MKKKIRIVVLIAVVCIITCVYFIDPILWYSQGLAFDYLPILSAGTKLDYIKSEKIIERYNVDNREEKLINICFFSKKAEIFIGFFARKICLFSNCEVL